MRRSSIDGARLLNWFACRSGRSHARRRHRIPLHHNRSAEVAQQDNTLAPRLRCMTHAQQADRRPVDAGSSEPTSTAVGAHIAMTPQPYGISVLSTVRSDPS